ncbi:host specificity factor TipJ family phage tail protein [Methylocaldum szegediense]|uniref:host specificity factor TipJ family phage tail protein n=1 Tax=Methylocaldum szegediense TaxID=73780 RepID=UPI000425E739|nr:host specificity factor TipJ family phage tail protein [Methylocaldum szegediense]
MKAVVVHVKNPLQPYIDRDIRELELTESLTINQIIAQEGLVFNLPTICVKNGEIILRADNRWDTEIVGDGDVVGFMTVLQGGRGSNPFMILAMIVLTVVTYGVGAYVGAAATAAGYSATAAGVIGGVAGGVVMAAGSALINMVIPQPKAPSSLSQKQMAAPSSVYSISAQGNQARIGQPIPVIYGEHRIYPDFAADPYTEFAGNEQYLYQLFCIGQGEYEIDPAQIRIEDTPISNFSEITYEIYGPNQTVTMFPTNVETIDEVSGQELLTNQYVPSSEGFLANSAGTSISSIAVDLVCPKGLFYMNDEGEPEGKSVSVVFEVALANDAGQRIGDWVGGTTANISGATNTPIRKTFRFNVPTPGRYMIRAKRIDAKDTSMRAGHDVMWTGARGFVEGSRNYGNVTMLAMKMRATNNLSQTSSRRVNLKVTRKLKVYDPNTGTWSATNIATRSIASALRDICEAQYGGRLTTNRFLLEDLEQLSVELNARGDYFDAVFDSRINVWEALSVTGRCGRTVPIRQGGVIRFIRDRQQTIPTAMFTMRNIVKDSLKVEYIMPNETTADAVDVEYFDRDSLKPKTYRAKLPGSTAEKPWSVKLFGCTEEKQAGREGLYTAANNRYRRRKITFRTELEGHLPVFGDLIAISHEMPSWGESGEILAFDGTTFTLSEPVTFKPDAEHFIALRKRDGSVVGSWKVAPDLGGDPKKVTLNPIVPLGFTPYTGHDEERTYFSFGPAGLVYMQAIVTRLVPRGNAEVEVEAINENISVHTAENGYVVGTPVNWQLPKRNTKPVLGALSVTQGGTSANPILLVSWSPAVNADHYVVEISRDNANWLRQPDVSSTSTSVPVEPGPVWLRVAPVGLTQGNWVTWNGVAGQVPPPGNVTGLAAEETFVGTKAKIKWNEAPRAEYYTVEIWAAGVLRRSVSVPVPRYEYTAEDVKKDGGPWRTLTFKVWANSSLGESESPAEITLSNPAPGPLTGVSVYAGVKSVVITYDRPADLDFEGVLVCMDTTQGFTPQPGVNEVYRGGDRTIVIPNLTEDVTYYFRLAAYDTFGIDGLDFGTNEYQATITSLNLPTPQETLEAVQEALDDTETGNKLVFNTEAFVVRLSEDENVIPFAIVEIEDQPTVVMQSNVYIMGHVSANQLRSGDIAADQRITLNNGRIALDGQGAIFVYDTGPDPNNPDFAVLTNGDLSFQRYRNGVYYEHKSVKRVETGQANSGTTVTLPGYWNAQPKIMVSPYSLQCYNKTAAQQDQTLSFAATNIREEPPGSGVWKFDAIAQLTFASNVGSTGVNQSVAQTNNDSWNSNQISLFNNTSQITVRVRFRSRKGVGTDSNYYYYRSVTWRVYGRVASNPTQWDQLSVKTRNIAAAEHDATISDSVNIAISPAGKYDRIYVAFTAGNSGGAYYIGAGSGQYEYATDQTPVSSNEESTPDGGVFFPQTVTETHPLSGYTLPSGWSWHSVTYYYEWRKRQGISNRQLTKVYFPHGTYWAAPETSYAAASVTDSGQFNPSRITVTAEGGYFTDGNIQAYAYTRNRYARITRKRLKVSDTNAYNNFYVDTVDWTLAGGTALAQGGLNWMAIGD